MHSVLVACPQNNVQSHRGRNRKCVRCMHQCSVRRRRRQRRRQWGREADGWQSAALKARAAATIPWPCSRSFQQQLSAIDPLRCPKVAWIWFWGEQARLLIYKAGASVWYKLKLTQTDERYLETLLSETRLCSISNGEKLTPPLNFPTSAGILKNRQHKSARANQNHVQPLGAADKKIRFPQFIEPQRWAL